MFLVVLTFHSQKLPAALPPRYASFYETASADRVLQYLVAFLVLLSTVKLWHLFRINSKINVFTATLERAWSDMSSFLLIVGLLLLAYSMAVSHDCGAKRFTVLYVHEINLATYEEKTRLKIQSKSDSPASNIATFYGDTISHPRSKFLQKCLNLTKSNFKISVYF